MITNNRMFLADGFLIQLETYSYKRDGKSKPQVCSHGEQQARFILCLKWHVLKKKNVYYFKVQNYF